MEFVGHRRIDASGFDACWDGRLMGAPTCQVIEVVISAD